MLARLKSRVYLWTAGLMSLVARRAVGTARSQRGATTAEYALVLALVAIALIGVLGQLGQALDMRLDEIIDQISGAGKE